jgi:hypothetical protein
MTNVNNGQIAQHPPVIPALPTTSITVNLTAAAVAATNPQQTVSIQDLTNAIQAADTAYVSSRKNAATAAATVFYVWTHTCSEHALEPNKAWYEVELSRLKNAIEAHNKQLEALKKDEDKKRDLEIEEYKKQNRPPNSDEAKQKHDAGIEKLKKDCADRKKHLTEQRMVKVEARADAAPFTEITKFVLKLNGPTQASQVSRFAKVVKWLSKHASPPTKLSIEEMAELILANNGFDAVYEQQRAADTTHATGTATTIGNADAKPTDAKPSEAILTHFRKMVEDVEGVLVPDVDGSAVTNDLVTLIARKEGNGLAIISKLAIPAEEVLRLCVHYKDDKLLPGDPCAEFVATALAAGELVEEGNRPAKDGDSVKIQRAFSLVADEAASKLVVSALGPDLSVVIHAKPNNEVMALFPKQGYWMLDPATGSKLLQKRLADAAERKMVTLQADTNEREVGDSCLISDLAWITTNEPLQINGDSEAVQVHPWLPMSPISQTPVDVDAFSPSGTLTVVPAELAKLLKGHIGKWASVKTDSKVAIKAANTVKVAFSKSKITVCTNAGDDVALCTGTMKKSATLHFRPRMLSKLIGKLGTLNVRDVKFAPDERGALQVTFDDDNGSYAIYVPSCKADGTALPARFTTIRVPQDDEA